MKQSPRGTHAEAPSRGLTISSILLLFFSQVENQHLGADRRKKVDWIAGKKLDAASDSDRNRGDCHRCLPLDEAPCLDFTFPSPSGKKL